MKPLYTLMCFIILGFANSIFQQENSKRFALVIGIQSYSNIAPLRNSLKDAKDISNVLQSKGFKVETLYDPKSKKEIRDAITRYYNIMSSQNNAVGIIYYAGHGVQHDGDNYLIPASASIQIPGDLDDQCIKMNSVMSVLNSSNNNLNILLLDACRTNNLPSFSRDLVKGLSPVEAPKGSIVVFATQPGTVASDGTEQNGLFTSKLLKYINEPNLNIGDILRKVKQDVNAESGGKQLPSVVDNSIGGEFYFSQDIKALAINTQQQAGNNSSINTDPSNYIAGDLNDDEEKLSASQLYEKGRTSQNPTQAIDWLKKASIKGSLFAKIDLGNIYFYGKGIKKDEEEGAKWYLMAAAQGDPSCQRKMGELYDQGKGVIQNTDEAIKWYYLASQKGDTYAYEKLLLLLTPSDDLTPLELYKEALNFRAKKNSIGEKIYLEKSGLLGFADAQFEMSNLTTNLNEQYKWLKLAADQGHKQAKSQLKIVNKLLSKEKCTGCESQNPWSKKGASKCYPTYQACTDALGNGCVICY